MAAPFKEQPERGTMKNHEGYSDPTAEKAISNVAKAEKSRVLQYNLQDESVRCPVCRKNLKKFVKYRINFCPWCGQKLN